MGMRAGACSKGYWMQSRRDRCRKPAIILRDKPAAHADEILADFALPGKCDTIGYNPDSARVSPSAWRAVLRMPGARAGRGAAETYLQTVRSRRYRLE
jgi:hypothetical protein